MTRVTVRDLSRNTAEVLERVSGGERIEVTRNGKPVAILSPPNPVDVVMSGLVKAGVMPSDWRDEQADLHQWLRDNPPGADQDGADPSAPAVPPVPSVPSPAAPADGRPLSEVLIDMRAEERT
ncbi:prevent-host-death family protein [Goodfellowiella coeruleoviolacea]|uniref:Antitoxin n=2 Tax=Goodfellowiella coeruleoviolacea TaxID=334858 RepID=A0AAE3GBS6_9PSEU|nr:prevent-host-death family protein [Goodfellowiella coeruleoviolacea]